MRHVSVALACLVFMGGCLGSAGKRVPVPVPVGVNVPVGTSTDVNGNKCETYKLRGKDNYGTVCDKSSPLYMNPSAQPYPNH
jgi:hypothetical protein